MTDILKDEQFLFSWQNDYQKRNFMKKEICRVNDGKMAEGVCGSFAKYFGTNVRHCEIYLAAALLGRRLWLFVYAYRYFKAELGEGTPFMQAGADRIRMLGYSVLLCLFRWLFHLLSISWAYSLRRLSKLPLYFNK